MLENILFWSGRSVVDLYTKTMLDMDVARHGALPEGAKIIAANHPTTFDPFLILTLAPGQMSILITETCFKVPVFGHYLRASGHIPVIHNNGRAALEEARRRLQAGRTIGIFPEGALSPLNGSVCEPRTGTARLALSTGVPVVPAGIHLDRERIRFFETQVDGVTEIARWYFRGPYAVTIGEPMYLAGDVEDWEHVRSVSAQIMGRIVQLAHESALRMQGSQAFVPGSITRPVKMAGRA
jgi:1-acyl-sn-glycerol-3-phosphate acyltransferase